MGNKRGGLLFGVIVGTLLGILFAPRKGKELRHQLKNEVSKGGFGVETFKKNFKEMGHDVANTAEEVYYRPEVQVAVQRGKKEIDKAMRNAGEQMNKAEQKMKDLGEKYLDMGDIGFTKKPLSKKKSPVQRKSAVKKSRTRKVKIKKRK